MYKKKKKKKNRKFCNFVNPFKSRPRLLNDHSRSGGKNTEKYIYTIIPALIVFWTFE